MTSTTEIVRLICFFRAVPGKVTCIDFGDIR